ncbi:MAG: hypothetical protein M3461_08825 [Pseudomonadota bacterium]|nr:hypothetical protein [Pseudomonadota bacterium]
MNTAIYLPQKQWQPRDRWRLLMRVLAPRALMAGALGLLVGLPPPVVYADGGDASLIHACVKKSKPRGQTRIVGQQRAQDIAERVDDVIAVDNALSVK